MTVLLVLSLALLTAGVRAHAQSGPARPDTSRREPATDTTLVQGAVYNRPFIGTVARTSIGGYVEGNTNYFVEDGIGDGFSMELRRFNIFLFSSLGPRLRFISELEFGRGTEEIELETALVDFQLDRALVLRAGIILPPIGAFNQNHDSPRWEFIDRALVSTRIIPSTLSEVGVGVNGKLTPGTVTLTYDAYLSNGLGEGVILNDEGRTLLSAGKSLERFGRDNNGSPAVSGRLGLQHGRLGEVGVSYYGGSYNTFLADGEVIDDERRLSIAALDINGVFRSVSLRGELAYARVELPDDLAELFGDRQWGAHLDMVVPMWRPRIFGLRHAVVNAGLRVERVDYNVGTFSETGLSRRDDVTAIVPGLSFRPTPGTVFKLNYRRHWTRDLLGNPAVRLGGYQAGFATYF